MQEGSYIGNMNSYFKSIISKFFDRQGILHIDAFWGIYGKYSLIKGLVISDGQIFLREQKFLKIKKNLSLFNIKIMKNSFCLSLGTFDVIKYSCDKSLRKFRSIFPTKNAYPIIKCLHVVPFREGISVVGRITIRISNLKHG